MFSPYKDSCSYTAHTPPAHTNIHTQLPWKPVKSIVAYYYMWKTTDRYQIQKRHRMLEKQNDLKEVIVHLRTSTGAPAGPRDLSGMGIRLDLLCHVPLQEAISKGSCLMY